MSYKIESILVATIILFAIGFSVSSLYFFGISPIMGKMAVLLLIVTSLILAPFVAVVWENS